MAEDKIAETSGWPVNELGEIVMEAGTGSTNIVGTLPIGFTPRNKTSDKVPVVMPAPRFDYPVRFATFGDSLTDTASVATHDLTSATPTLFNNKGLRGNRLAMLVSLVSRGRIIPVANCGLGGTVSGGDPATMPTAIVNRDLNAPSIDRRGLKDAADMGAKVVLISLGRNDVFANIRANSSLQAQNDLIAFVSANVVTAVKRAQALGLYPILRELAGYFYEDVPYNYAKNAAFTPADVEVQKSVINRMAVHIRDNVVPTLGDVGFLRIREGMVDEKGEWYRQYSDDGLHENYNGGRVIAKRLAAMIDSMTRPLQQTTYAPLPSNAGRINGFANAALLPPYTSGRVAGIDYYVDPSNGNAATIVAVPPVDGPDGRRWQDFIVTPTGFAGGAKKLAPNGLSNVIFYVRFAVTGATPLLPIAVGDVYRQECDIIIDDGAGNPPPVLAWGAKSVLGYSGTNFSLEMPSVGVNDPDLQVMEDVIEGKLVSLPVVSPAASADITSCFISITPYTGSTKPYRVRIGAPRMIKYPVL